jgi:hypothetical protein
MGRIRQVKPEFWTSLAIGELSRDARLLFIGLWNYADDEGRGVDDARLIKGDVFPLDDDMGAAEVEALMCELAAKGRVLRYTSVSPHGGRRYISVTNWSEHQYVQRKRPSLLPAPPVTCPDDPLREPSVSPHGALREPSVLGQGLGSGVRGQGSGVAPQPSADDAGMTTPPSQALVVTSRATPAVRATVVDPLWDAVMAACGVDGQPTPSARGAYNRAVADLRSVGADPDDVTHRASNYRARFPDAALTPPALARHWAECNGHEPAGRRSEPKGAQGLRDYQRIRGDQ